MRVWLVTGVLALVLVSPLAACGEKDPPAADPPPSPATSVPAKPKPKPLSPEQTVRAWVRAYNHVLSTGNRMAFDELSSVSCRTCDNLVKPVAQAIARAGKIKGGDWRLDRLRRAGSHRRNIVFDAAVTSAGGRTRRRGGDTFHSFAVDHFIVELRLAREAANWRMTAIVWLR